MQSDREPTGTEKLQFVAEQMTVPEGQAVVLDCPYCYGRTVQGEQFCCDLLARAFKAILDAEEQIRIANFMDKVIDRHMSN